MFHGLKNGKQMLNTKINVALSNISIPLSKKDDLKSDTWYTYTMEL